MSIYSYKAFDKNNKVINGEYEASSEKEVFEYLNNHHLNPLSIRQNDGASRNTGMLSTQIFGNVSYSDILFLVRNLSATIKAGLSIVESLDILIKDSKKGLMKNILEGISAMVKNGQQLSVSFESYKKYFPPIFVGMVKAGEMSGQLDKNLKELSSYLSKEYTLRSKVKSALMYPVILLIASTAVVILMLTLVLPKLTQSFAASGVALPWITKVFMSISRVLAWSYSFDVVILIGIIFFFSYFRNTKIGKRIFFSVISRLPIARNLVKKIALVRFSRVFGNLIGSGLSAVDSLLITSVSIDNQHYTDAIKEILIDIKNGVTIAGAVEKYNTLFPGMLISLIAVGERTGSLQEILINFADFYEEEVDNELKELTSILEPVLLLFMGLMIGSIAISIILPIYQLVGHFV